MGTSLVKVNLQGTLSTDAPAQSLSPFDAELGPAPFEKNNGIERNGGIRVAYQKKYTKAAAEYVQYTKSGKRVSLKVTPGTSGIVSIDGEEIYNVGQAVGVRFNVPFPYEAYDVISAPVANQFDALILKVSGAARLYLQRWEYAPTAGTWSIISEIAIAITYSAYNSLHIVRGSVDYATQANNKFVVQDASNFNVLYKSGDNTTVATHTGFTSFGEFYSWKIAGDSNYVLVRIDEPWTYIDATATTRTGYGWPSINSDGTAIIVFRVPIIGAAQVGISIVIASGAETAINVANVPTAIHYYINVMGGLFVSYDSAAGDETATFWGATKYARNIYRSAATEAIGIQQANTAAGVVHYYFYYTVSERLSHLGGACGAQNIGNLISEVGELFPHHPISVIPGVNNCVYKTITGYKCIGISDAYDDIIQRVDDEVVMLGYDTGRNLVDAEKKRAMYGATGFNNAIIVRLPPPFGGPGSALTIAARVDGGERCQSVDVGEKIYTGVGFMPISATGQRYYEYFPTGALMGQEMTGLTMDYFENSVYVGSGRSSGVDYIRLIQDQNKADTVYVQDINIPIPCSARILDSIAATKDKTFFLESRRIGYLIGNELPFRSQGFILFGTKYIFDGDTIFIVSFDTSGMLASYDRIAIADGLTFLTVTPTEAWFLSSWDNSLWTFDGGRNVTKRYRLNDKSPILGGAYCVPANELLLYEGSGKALYLRDGVFTETTLGVTAAGTLSLQADKNGTWVVPIGGVGDIAQLVHNSTGATVIPLDWQTAYQGLGNFQRGLVQEYMFTVYDSAKTAGTVAIEWNGFTETAPLTAETRTVTLVYDSLGYSRFSFVPANGNVIGSSIRLQSSLPLTIIAATIKIGDATTGLTVLTNRGV